MARTHGSTTNIPHCKTIEEFCTCAERMRVKFFAELGLNANFMDSFSNRHTYFFPFILTPVF